MAAIQENRKIQVFTPLGENDLLFYKMEGQECLSEPFEFKLNLLSKIASIKPEDLLGELLTVRIELADGGWRYFNGYVTRFGRCENFNEYLQYRVEIRPWLWILKRASNCRIFQNKTAPDIISEVFRDQGFSDFQTNLNASYSTREYCVQYRETDFNFVSRLMEEEGIFYYFKHEDGKHTLVLVDANTALTEFPGYESIPYHADASSTDRSRTDHVYQWEYSREIQTGHYEITDYDFKKPKSDLLVKLKYSESHSHAEHEFFDYPGRYTETSAGDHYVQQRMEELHARFDRSQGKANARGLAVGSLFSLANNPHSDVNKQYLVISASYELILDEYTSNFSGSSTDRVFDCSFVVQDKKIPFRPPRIAPKPLIHGAQTAIVVGPSGEEIYTDQYGRVKVQFHWDRYGQKDQESSCWIRVAHPWAGKNWGMVAIPRIGHEVVVDFLEGDPDQPLIVGSVYNGDNMPPYALPANATQTGIKSRSSKGGGSANFNEIRFEDKMGSEEMYIHAEKDQNILVENDRNEEIDRDRALLVKRDKSETVERNKVVHIVGNHSENIDGAMSIVIGKTLTESVLINYAETVGGAMELTVGAALAITVGAAMAEAVAGTKSEAIGGSKTESIGHNKTMTIGENLTEIVKGNQSVKIDKDLTETITGKRRVEVTKESMLQAKKIQITAEDEINLKAGKAEIIMKKNGDITIKGGKITIKGSSDLILKGSKISEN